MAARPDFGSTRGLHCPRCRGLGATACRVPGFRFSPSVFYLGRSVLRAQGWRQAGALARALPLCVARRPGEWEVEGFWSGGQRSDALSEGRRRGREAGRPGRRADRRADGRAVGRLDGLTVGRSDGGGRSSGRAGRWSDGRAGGRMGGRSVSGAGGRAGGRLVGRSNGRPVGRAGGGRVVASKKCETDVKHGTGEPGDAGERGRKAKVSFL